MACFASCFSTDYRSVKIPSMGPLAWIATAIKRGREDNIYYPAVSLNESTKFPDLTKLQPIDENRIDSHFLSTHVFIHKSTFEKNEPCRFFVFHEKERIESSPQPYLQVVEKLKEYFNNAKKPILFMEIG
jgi:hypothetical protein